MTGKKKTKSLVKAYGRGFRALLLAGLSIFGAALAWRLANRLVDKFLGEKKV